MLFGLLLFYVLLVNAKIARPDLSKFSVAQLQAVFKKDVRVIRGRDWSWGTQGSGGPGTITQGLGNYSSTNWVQVRWDDGHLNAYRMGSGGRYDLYLQIPGKASLLSLSIMNSSVICMPENQTGFEWNAWRHVIVSLTHSGVLVAISFCNYFEVFSLNLFVVQVACA